LHICGSIETTGNTIAVLPSGLKNIYPKENIDLYNKILENNGLIVTEYEDNEEGTSERFLERNRIVSGLAIGTLVIEAGIKILVGLTEGIMDALPRLIARLPEIIIKICSVLINLLPQILSAGIRIIAELALGIIRGIPDLISKIPQIITSMISALGKGISSFVDIGANLLKGLWQGISNTKDWLVNKVKSIGSTITGAIKSIFGIHSPSRVMRDEIGVNLAKGIGAGFEKEMPDLLSDVNGAMSDLNSEVQASVNPTINPTANSNPLILNIDKFINNTEKDIQALAEELEFYRKNSSLAKGGA